MYTIWYMVYGICIRKSRDTYTSWVGGMVNTYLRTGSFQAARAKIQHRKRGSHDRKSGWQSFRSSGCNTVSPSPLL